MSRAALRKEVYCMDTPCLVFLTKEGGLILEGQDLGGKVREFWQSTEYEWG